MTIDSERFQNAQRAITDALALYVGPGRRFGCDALADATGIHVGAIRTYLRGEATPSVANLLAMMASLPPEFTNAVLAHAGLGGARRIEAGEIAAGRVNTILAEGAAMVSRHLEDGRVDHRERAEEARVLRELGTRIGEYVAGLERGGKS